MKRAKAVLILSLACLLVVTTSAQQARKIKVDFKDVKLESGLRVLLVEDHNAPVVSVAITYEKASRRSAKRC